jgi:hypothetical protein
MSPISRKTFLDAAAGTSADRLSPALVRSRQKNDARGSLFPGRHRREMGAWASSMNEGGEIR